MPLGIALFYGLINAFKGEGLFIIGLISRELARKLRVFSKLLSRFDLFVGYIQL